ncbi:SacI-like domain protein (macronuclear) [Tetrahymena thermophila SB210]|uniref:SacI-like domain protein n=1 Tax=Tetrahymena thermophila (strain SB210) TaxID=312017 RepID=Q22GV5_TETTS|nr:SacI-like domain protein [Tetrahymena thermophila SB210]EAR84569.2 SacI-like domain protein [Tetrahymena thermophila SB210]|eukprot:XP_001032232.2 SacI-like domain protein [Tetrahymena thermophila SB210]
MNLEYPQNPGGLVYKRMRLYTTKKQTIIMGYSKYEKEYKLLYISKSQGNDKSNICQDQGLKYIIEEDKQRFSSIEEAEQSIKKTQEIQKSLNFVCKFYGIVGFYKFLEGYYMVYIKEIKKIAKIGRHKLWTIQKTEVLKLFDGKNSSKEEQQFRKQLNEYDMTQGFYSSYSYDLTNTLNRNMMRNALEIIDSQNKYQNQLNLDRRYSQSKQLGQFCEIFMWNYYAVQQFYHILQNKKWVIPIIHGYLEQKNLKSLNSSFSITIISRRCRHHAGTRFCKRGLNQEGFAANYVETEQIVIDLESTHRRPACSSFVQIRGSAPVFWHQDPSLFDVKPQIQINQCDPYYSATKKHFGDLYARYGEKIFCMDLVKSTQTQTNEEKLAQVYNQVVEEINCEIESKQQITYFHFDMKKQLKTDKIEYVEKSYTFAYYVVHQIGIFLVQDSKRSKLEQCVEIQNGVLRSNCVDCLDRTNSFQQLVGEIALAIQLAKMFQSSCKFSDLNVHEKVLVFYRGMFERMGDIISEQYGSSKAHKQNIKEQKTKWRFELFTSIQRHFKNNLSDSARQQSIDLFLGNFIPDENQKIWQNPIKQFQPKNGYEILVFKNHNDSISSSRQNSITQEQERSSNKSKQNINISYPIKNEEKSWWQRSIMFFKEETCVNLIRRIMEEEFNQSPEVFERQYLPLFKNYQIPLHNQRNKFTFKKFQIEFINIINKYDKSKLQLSTQSLKFVITLPKNYLFINFQNTFQKISRKEISEKLSREYNKLIHLFPDLEFNYTQTAGYEQEKMVNVDQEKGEKQRNSGAGKEMFFKSQHKLSRIDFINNVEESKKNIDQFDIIPEKQYSQIEEKKLSDNEAINFSTMNRSEKVINYQNLEQINEMENSQIDDKKADFFRQDENSDLGDIQQENYSPPINNIDNQEEVITYLEPKTNPSSFKIEQAYSTIYNQQSTMNGLQKLSQFQGKLYQNSQEITLQERFLIDDYFSTKIKTINEEDIQLQQSVEKKRNFRQSKNQQQSYQSNNNNNENNYELTLINNTIDEYFSYNKINQKKITDQSENYFEYKDIALKQNISNEINGYFDNKLPNSSTNNANQKIKCPRCNLEQNRFDDNKMVSSYDNLRVRGHTTFFQKNDVDYGEKGSSRLMDTLCKHHHTEYMIQMSSYSNIHQGTQFNIAAQSQFRVNENGMSRIESEIGQSEISSDIPQKQRQSNETDGKKKNVQLLDMLVKRNFIFPQNTIINVV